MLILCANIYNRLILYQLQEYTAGFPNQKCSHLFSNVQMRTWILIWKLTLEKVLKIYCRQRPARYQ